jgi:hypothetical protein
MLDHPLRDRQELRATYGRAGRYCVQRAAARPEHIDLAPLSPFDSIRKVLIRAQWDALPKLGFRQLGGSIPVSRQ